MKARSKLDFEKSFQAVPEKHHKTILPTAPLPEPISQNIEALIALLFIKWLQALREKAFGDY